MELSLKTILKTVVISSLLLFLVGCAQPSNHERMALSQQDMYNFKTQSPKNASFKNNLALNEVQGGKKTNPLWTSQVDAKSFGMALTESLKKGALYSSDNDKARYRLQANLLKLDQPLIGFNFTVTSHINYKLLDTKNNTVIFEKTLVTPYTAKMTDNFYGPERLRKANEGAIKENIKVLMTSLYEI